MPLFNVTIEIRTTVNIPVSAPSEEAAWEYVRNEQEEWMKDGEISALTSDHDMVRPISLCQVSHPAQVGYPGETICWGPEYYDANNEWYGYEHRASDAFYGIPVAESDTDEGYQKQYDEQFRLRELFNEEQKVSR